MENKRRLERDQAGIWQAPIRARMFSFNDI